MARYRLSSPAKADVVSILLLSETNYGPEARIRYRALLTAALRRIAADPDGPTSLDRSEVRSGLRSLHVRHCRIDSRERPVRGPVHVVFYQALEPGLVEVVRVLHERMEPSRHVVPRTDE
jgi:toxin ParE1/3/4